MATFYPNVYIKADLLHYLPSSSLTPLLLKYPCFSCGFGLVPKKRWQQHFTLPSAIWREKNCCFCWLGLSDINLIAEKNKRNKKWLLPFDGKTTTTSNLIKEKCDFPTNHPSVFLDSQAIHPVKWRFAPSSTATIYLLLSS